MRIGSTVRYIRQLADLNQREAAGKLGITSVHLCNVERGRSDLSPYLRERFREVFGVDLYITAWLRGGDIEKLPKRLRAAAEKLATIWKRELEQIR